MSRVKIFDNDEEEYNSTPTDRLPHLYTGDEMLGVPLENINLSPCPSRSAIDNAIELLRAIGGPTGQTIRALEAIRDQRGLRADPDFPAYAEHDDLAASMDVWIYG